MVERVGSHIRQNVVGYIALFVALSGTAWAASELDKNEVKSKHIGNGQVKAKDLGKNSVTSPKVADGSLLDEDFAPGQLPAGPPGPPGADATNLFAYVRDPGPGATEDAEVQYGSGVTSVEEIPGTLGTYYVFFNRDLTNCVAGAVTGQGQPVGSPAPINIQFAMPRVIITGPQTVQVGLDDENNANVDTSFLITAFC